MQQEEIRQLFQQFEQVACVSGIVEAHHIIPFTESTNHYTLNIILSPSYHRSIHKAKPRWNRTQLAFCFPNGLVEKVMLNKHL